MKFKLNLHFQKFYLSIKLCVCFFFCNTVDAVYNVHFGQSTSGSITDGRCISSIGSYKQQKTTLSSKYVFIDQNHSSLTASRLFHTLKITHIVAHQTSISNPCMFSKPFPSQVRFNSGRTAQLKIAFLEESVKDVHFRPSLKEESLAYQTR